MNSSGENINLGEAASRFLSSLPSENKEVIQSEVYRFVRWYGRERPLAALSAPEIANYAEQLSLSDTEYLKKLELVRAFLTHARKEGWSKSNLVIHLKAKKRETKLQPVSRRGLPEPTSLTQGGYQGLMAELETLKDKRLLAIEEMNKAAADKDFRENAPLQAAKEERDRLEGMIRELEGILKSAIIVSDKNKKHESSLKVSLGDQVTLRDLASAEELRYIIVGPREVDPIKGRISDASPIGKAIMGQAVGKVVEVVVPAGKLKYQIDRIER